MSGIRIEIGIDHEALSAGLGRALRLAEDPRQLLAETGKVIEASIDDRFDSGRGPGGIPWTPSRRAVEKGGKTLVDRGYLRSSIETNIVGKHEVQIGVGANKRGNADKYAAAHQFGAYITPKKGKHLVFTGADGGLVFASSVDIPARPFLGIDEQDTGDLRTIWGSGFRDALTGGKK